MGRGLPYYTVGLKLLFDGLRLVNDLSPGQELEVAIEKLRPYMAAADWRAETTTFCGIDPSIPRPSSDYA